MYDFKFHVKRIVDEDEVIYKLEPKPNGSLS
jgi:hypothetical protein